METSSQCIWIGFDTIVKGICHVLLTRVQSLWPRMGNDTRIPLEKFQEFKCRMNWKDTGLGVRQILKSHLLSTFDRKFI